MARIKGCALASGLIAVTIYGFLLMPGIRKTSNLWDLFWYSLYCFEDDGVYAPEYSDRAFKEVSIGDPMSKVYSSLGLPLRISYYGPNGAARHWNQSDGGQEGQEDRIEQEIASYESDTRPWKKGTSVEAWHYSRGYPNTNYWFRFIAFDARGRVVYKNGELFVD